MKVNLSGCCLLFTPPNFMESSIIIAGNMNQKVSRFPIEILSSPFSSINWFPSVVDLNLSNCGISLDDVFDSLNGLSSLEILDLSNNPIRRIKKDLRTLPRLQRLELKGCKYLRSISQLPRRIYLFAPSCLSLERIEYHKNPLLESAYVTAHDCPKLAAIENVLMVELIKKLDADKAKYMGYSKLESFQGITGLFASMEFDLGLFTGVYQFGIYSIFLDRDRLLEDWFTVTNLGSEILYTVHYARMHIMRLSIF